MLEFDGFFDVKQTIINQWWDLLIENHAQSNIIHLYILIYFSCYVILF